MAGRRRVSFCVAVVLLLSSSVFLSCRKKTEICPFLQCYCISPGADTISMIAHSCFNQDTNSAFSGWFYNDAKTASLNSIQIILPSRVSSGTTFHAQDSNFSFLYIMPNGHRYRTYYYHNSFTLTITLWEGKGGRVSGTFYGILFWEYWPAHYSAVISDGVFEGRISD